MRRGGNACIETSRGAGPPTANLIHLGDASAVSDGLRWVACGPLIECHVCRVVYADDFESMEGSGVDDSKNHTLARRCRGADDGYADVERKRADRGGS